MGGFYFLTEIVQMFIHGGEMAERDRRRAVKKLKDL